MTIETHTTNRKELAQMLAEELHEPMRYLGVPSCAYQVGAYTIDKNGAIHGEDFTQIHDFLLRHGFITEETPDDSRASSAFDAQELEDGAFTVQINLPTNELTHETLVKFLRMLYARQDLIAAMTRCNSLRIDAEVATCLTDAKPDSLEQISELLTTEKQFDKLSGIELQPEGLVVTLESDMRRKVSWNAWCDLIRQAFQAAKKAHAVGAKRVTPDGESTKYYCYMWLTQIGMGGADFKESRRLLLQHLQGAAAFKTREQQKAHAAKYRRTTDKEEEHEQDS